MKVVGCDNPEVVHRSATAILGALEDHLAPGNLCLLGPLPTPADFALYGQLSQLVVDRSSDTLLRDSFPACWAWIRRLEDLSGLEEGGEYSPTDFLERMLKFAAEVYLPFLADNRAAIKAGEKEVETTLWKSTHPLEHRQPVFRYQDKCLTRIQTALKGLPEPAKSKVEKKLKDTGCLSILNES